MMTKNFILILIVVLYYSCSTEKKEKSAKTDKHIGTWLLVAKTTITDDTVIGVITSCSGAGI